ncbi:DEAD/DEAH box helicase family protein, partial [Escherichia coli]|uniref:DEAD/DEAH box helicase family protein n=1 Tax=Escherichia coli TaxID=562 RepID=UPI00217FC9B4
MTDDFAPDGQLAKAIPGFKPREPQRQMAVAVTQAIEKGQPLVVEAGTGTGKTYAYLALMNPLMILVKIIKLRWIHILSYDQMVSRKINNQTTR